MSSARRQSADDADASRSLVVALYAPMKSPDHPVPSGDREIARRLVGALDLAGLSPRVVSQLRVFDGAGDTAAQSALARAADAEAERLIARLSDAPPCLWLTYHCHYKAPDLVGPAVAGSLEIPYAIVEPSISPKRRGGPWAAFAARSEAAIAAADRLFWTTERDRPALIAAGHGARMVHLPPFVDPGPQVAPRGAHDPLRLLTVAMMRPGDKLESYRRLAAGLGRLLGDWRLRVVGDGPSEPAVTALLAPFGNRVVCLGAIDDASAIRREMEAADLLLWPGVGEGIGMVWLEAQAAGLPVVAERGPAARDVVVGSLSAPDDADALAATVGAAALDRMRLSSEARARIEARHTLSAAAATLGVELRAMIE